MLTDARLALCKPECSGLPGHSGQCLVQSRPLQWEEYVAQQLAGDRQQAHLCVTRLLYAKYPFLGYFVMLQQVHKISARGTPDAVLSCTSAAALHWAFCSPFLSGLPALVGLWKQGQAPLTMQLPDFSK